jgi:hypothetical protein
MNFLKITLFIFILCLFHRSAFACEPVVPLAMLFGIPLYSLFGVIILKAILFVWLEKSIPIHKSILFIVIANIFSSLIGLGLVLATSVPSLIFAALPVVYFISITPSKRLVEFNPWEAFKNWNSNLLSIIIVGLYFSTFVLFGFAQSKLDSSLTLYWVLKFLYVFIALTVSIGLTTLWEEWVIYKLSQNKGNFLINVLKVNLVTFFLIMAYFAAMALPERLQSRNFLI